MTYILLYCFLVFNALSKMRVSDENRFEIKAGEGENKMHEKGLCAWILCFHYVIQNIICKCVSSKIFLLCETNWNAGIQLNIWLNILYLWHVHLMLLLWVAIVLLSCWANLFWDLESDTWIFCFWEKIQAVLFICNVPNCIC